MNILLMSAFSTFVFALLCIWKKIENRVVYIILFFILTLGLNYTCHAKELTFSERTSVKLSNNMKDLELTFIEKFICTVNKTLTEHDVKHAKWFREFHWEEFLEDMEWLQEEATLMPDINEREITKVCIDGMMAGIATRNVVIGTLTALSMIFSDCLMSVYDEWRYMRMVIQRAEYHLEMYYFYDAILINKIK